MLFSTVEFLFVYNYMSWHLNGLDTFQAWCWLVLGLEPILCMVGRCSAIEH